MLNVKDAKYDLGAMGVMAIVGIIIKICFSQDVSSDGTTGPANAAIWGYGLVGMSLICVTFIKYSLDNYHDQYSNLTDNIYSKLFGGLNNFLEVLPLLSTFIIVMWAVILYSYFLNQINTGKVTTNFNNLSWAFTVVILFQILIVFRSLHAGDDARTQQTGALAFLFTLINGILLSIMTINLQYFTTDG